MGSSDIRVLLWDNDGVLVDTERIYFETCREALAGLGVDLTEDLYRELYLRDSRGGWHLAEARGVSRSRIDATRDARNRRYAQRLRRETVEVAGAREALVALRPHYRMALVTSSLREPFEAVHRRTGFIEFFDLVLTRETYARSKPDPEPYRLAVDRLGADPGECLVIEDSPRGLAAARAAGIRCWIVPGTFTRGDGFPGAERVLGSVGEVAAALRPA